MLRAPGISMSESISKKTAKHSSQGWDKGHPRQPDRQGQNAE
jgi:hypothetical protein